MPKSIFASKTLWVNLLSAIVAILEGQQIIDLIPAEWQATAAAVVFAINIALRYVTVAPVTIGTPK